MRGLSGEVAKSMLRKSKTGSLTLMHTWRERVRLTSFLPPVHPLMSFWPTGRAGEACGCSLAHVDPLGDPALVAHHVAAPVEAAVAAFAARLLQDIVATATAQ